MLLWLGLVAWLLAIENITGLGVMMIFDPPTLLTTSTYPGRSYGYGLRKILRGAGGFGIYRSVNAFQSWIRLIKSKRMER